MVIFENRNKIKTFQLKETGDEVIGKFKDKVRRKLLVGEHFQPKGKNSQRR